jgi:mono/diheme cytochrome c family protein
LKWVFKRVTGYPLLLLFALAVASPAIEAAPPAAPAPVQTDSRQTTGANGAAIYAKNCSICHGDQREGIPPAFPPLTGIRHQMTAQQVAQLIRTGKGRMPAFTTLPDPDLQALVVWLEGTEEAGSAQNSSENTDVAGSVHAGDALFHQNCAFCHGRDAMGGESGPDLTQSKLVLADKGGDKIGPVVREGRPGTKMPGFNFSSQEMQQIVAFLHARVAAAASQQGSRRGVSVADLQTGNVEAGKAYFNGAGGCAKCHSPAGDLAGVASRYEGLQLEERMLYPRNAKSTVTVTLSSGEKITGTLAYRDEFTIGLRDNTGQYRSWNASRVRYTVDSPVEAHVQLFSQYTDDDIHNLMAYIQTLH